MRLEEGQGLGTVIGAGDDKTKHGQLFRQYLLRDNVIFSSNRKKKIHD
jgi:hypothetical protein